ncbi:fimbrial protein [Buttiauxella selenatireducens]|uniref:Fimbrial protein n=1 Tax=Buttiauxella selenatireducens TaxID=3073902 RepID=A0ABY9SCU4_9ENTR|nr:fimbrial protein [Buttiauxella sp. R73]WMY75332.1 fimbrial protein [Buttiauxella sp. R73]
MKSFIKIILFSLSVTSFYCHANCTLNGSTITQTVSPTSFTVQRDTPIGSVVKTIDLPLSNQQMGGCSSGAATNYYRFIYNGAQPSGYPHYYKTPVVGIAMSATTTGMNGGLFGYYDNPQFVDSFSGPIGIYTGTKTTISFIKIADVVPGVLPAGQIGTWTADSGSTFMNLFMNSLSISQVACSINTPALIFPIGNVLVSSFGSSIGTTPAVAQNTQNLGLNCNPGANINVSLSGTQNPDVSTTSVLALTGQGGANVAKGVGVQILYNSSPLVLNSRIVLKTSSGGQETFPLTARYYQTKTTVATGTANASATLNITYQ